MGSSCSSSKVCGSTTHPEQQPGPLLVAFHAGVRWGEVCGGGCANMRSQQHHWSTLCLFCLLAMQEPSTRTYHAATIVHGLLCTAAGRIRRALREISRGGVLRPPGLSCACGCLVALNMFIESGHAPGKSHASTRRHRSHCSAAPQPGCARPLFCLVPPKPWLSSLAFQVACACPAVCATNNLPAHIWPSRCLRCAAARCVGTVYASRTSALGPQAHGS